MSLRFWQRWLLVVAGGVMIYSSALIVLPDIMRNLFNTLFFAAPNAVFSEDAMAYIRLVQGVLGAVLIGWMLTIVSILISSFKRGERSAWYTIAVPVVVWFVVDTGFSLYSGVPAHALFNIPFLILFAIPLAATFKTFHARG